MREVLRHCFIRSASGGANYSMNPTGSLNITATKKLLPEYSKEALGHPAHIRISIIYVMG